MSRLLITLVIITHCTIMVEGQCDANQPLILNATGEAQYLTSPNYPENYESNLDCSWRVTVPSGQIFLNVEHVRVESCSYDYFFVYEGDDSTGTDIGGGRQCDSTINLEIGTSFYVEFTTDSSVTRQGFSFLYFTNDSAYQLACNTSDLVGTTTPQYIMSSNIPGVYSANYTCSWTITVEGFLIVVLIRIKFLDIESSTSCTADALTVYDGTSSGDPVLATLCTRSMTYIFDDIQSTGSNALIRFTTDGVNEYYGFLLTYESTTITTTTTTTTTTSTTTTTLPTTTFAPEINSECSRTTVELTTDFWPNYLNTVNFGSGNYEANQSCTWRITAPTNYSVALQFDSAFNVEYSTYCNFDYLEFYDGYNQSSPLMNRLCGSLALPNVYKTSSTEAFVLFNSDDSVTKSGFRLIYWATINTYPGCKADYTSYDATYNQAPTWNGNYYTISSTNFSLSSTYASNTDDYWLITNFDNTTKIIINITYIDIERSRGCVYDRLIIYNGPCTRYGIYDTVCGYWKKTYELIGEEYLLHFHSDNSFNNVGFQLTYYVIPLPTPIPPTTSTTTIGPPIGAVVAVMESALENYQNDALPARDLSLAISSTIDFYLVGINDINEVEQKMVSTGQFVVTWTDASMSWLPAKRANAVRMLMPQDDLWRPDIALMNGVTQLQQMGASFMYIDVDYNGSCIWKPYQIMESVCKIDMTFYPYDTQTCALQFGTWSTSDSQVTTTLGSNGLSIHPLFTENSEWTLLTWRSDQVVLNTQNIIKFTFSLKRNPTYITFYMTIPTVMLAYLNVFTFAIPCETGEKSGFSITIFLSFVVVLIVVQDSMPDNSDTVSLYAAYLLTMTLLTTIALMITVFQIRAISFSEDEYKIKGKLKKIVKKINRLQSLIFFCGKLPPSKVKSMSSLSSESDVSHDKSDDDSTTDDSSESKSISSVSTHSDNQSTSGSEGIISEHYESENTQDINSKCHEEECGFHESSDGESEHSEPATENGSVNEENDNSLGNHEVREDADDDFRHEAVLEENVSKDAFEIRQEITSDADAEANNVVIRYEIKQTEDDGVQSALTKEDTGISRYASESVPEFIESETNEQVVHKEEKKKKSVTFHHADYVEYDVDESLSEHEEDISDDGYQNDKNLDDNMHTVDQPEHCEISPEVGEESTADLANQTDSDANLDTPIKNVKRVSFFREDTYFEKYCKMNNAVSADMLDNELNKRDKVSFENSRGDRPLSGMSNFSLMYANQYRPSSQMSRPGSQMSEYSLKRSNSVLDRKVSGVETAPYLTHRPVSSHSARPRSKQTQRYDEETDVVPDDQRPNSVHSNIFLHRSVSDMEPRPSSSISCNSLKRSSSFLDELEMTSNRLESQNTINVWETDLEKLNKTADEGSEFDRQSIKSRSSDGTVKEDDPVTWTDVVVCSDFICFFAFFIVTTVFTLAFILSMI